MTDRLSRTVAPFRLASSTERSKALRERRRQGEGPQLVECLACGRTVQQLQQAERPEAERLLCSACWRRSPAGKAADAERKRLERARKREAGG